MEPSATGRSYDQLAREWQNTPPTYGMAALERAIQFTKNRGDALDIGCGSRGCAIDLLLRHGFHPEGIDVSVQMIALAREHHPAIPFHQANICEWPLAKKYDLIVAWDSVWHVPLTQQETVLQKICEGLNPGGIYLFTTGGLDEPGEKSNPFFGTDVPLYHCTLGVPRYLELLAKFGCVCRHLEYDQYPEMHLYFIAQKMNSAT